MKWLAVVALAALAVVASAELGGAQNAPARSAELAKLKREVAALQKQVATLRTQVSAVRKQATGIDDELDANFTGDGCIVAATADLLAATWATVDQLATQTAQRTFFQPQLRFDDDDACESLINPDVTRNTNLPPNFATYDELIAWIRP